MADSFNELNDKFETLQNNIIKTNDNSVGYDFDELKAYFGEDYTVARGITIHIPKIQDILNYGDIEFYSVVSTLCSNPTSFRLQLWNIGVDWNEISDFQLFSILIKTLTPDMTSLIFNDLDLSSFEQFHDNIKDCDVLVSVSKDEDGNILPFNYEDSIIIDEYIYTRIVQYLRFVYDIHPKVEKAKNKATKKAMIWEDQMNADLEKKKTHKKNKSYLLPLVSSLVNHPGFKYNLDELRNVNIVQFMDSVKRLQIYENTTALLKGVYSGFISSKDINNKELNWLRDLDE